MPRRPLNDTTLRSLKAPASGQVTFYDAGLRGFGIRLAAKGARTWVAVYHRAGRVRRVTLGHYPLMSLGDARAKAKETLASVELGNDPAAERTAQREAATFAEVAAAYIKNVSRTDENGRPVSRSWAEKKRMLEADVTPAWGTRKGRDITARDVRELLDGIVERGAPIAANRTFALIRRVFTWAAAPDRALVPQHHNPCRGMERPAPERQRERVLDADELRRGWSVLEGEDGYNAALVKLRLYTAQRNG